MIRIFNFISAFLFLRFILKRLNKNRIIIKLGTMIGFIFLYFYLFRNFLCCNWNTGRRAKSATQSVSEQSLTVNRWLEIVWFGSIFVTVVHCWKNVGDDDGVIRKTEVVKNEQSCKWRSGARQNLRQSENIKACLWAKNARIKPIINRNLFQYSLNGLR